MTTTQIFDLLMEMTEAEFAAEEAAVDRELAELERRIASLPVARQIAFYRRSALQTIRDNRRRLREPDLCTIPFIVDMWRQGIRRAQLKLVKLRTWRSTGVYPGTG